MKFTLEKDMIVPDFVPPAGDKAPKNRRKVHKGWLSLALMFLGFLILDEILLCFGPEGTRLGFIVAGMLSSLGMVFCSIKSLRLL